MLSLYKIVVKLIVVNKDNKKFLLVNVIIFNEKKSVCIKFGSVEVKYIVDLYSDSVEE